MAKKEIEAFFEYLRNCPAELSLWEKESLAAGAVLALTRKAKKKLTKKKTALKREY